jgi:hypothetical protein
MKPTNLRIQWDLHQKRWEHEEQIWDLEGEEVPVEITMEEPKTNFQEE